MEPVHDGGFEENRFLEQMQKTRHRSPDETVTGTQGYRIYASPGPAVNSLAEPNEPGNSRNGFCIASGNETIHKFERPATILFSH